MQVGDFSRRGFTVTEIIIVIVVVAILATIAAAAYSGVKRSAARSSVVSTLANAQKHMDMHVARGLSICKILWMRSTLLVMSPCN